MLIKEPIFKRANDGMIIMRIDSEDDVEILDSQIIQKA